MHSLDIVPDGRTIQIVIPSDLKLVFADLNGPKIVIEVAKLDKPQKPGPKVQPEEIKADKLKSTIFHEPILAFLAAGEASTADIRAAVAALYPDADTNSVSWALVELQNENRRRGKSQPKTGPIIKTETGYRLR